VISAPEGGAQEELDVPDPAPEKSEPADPPVDALVGQVALVGGPRSPDTEPKNATNRSPWLGVTTSATNGTGGESAPGPSSHVPVPR